MVTGFRVLKPGLQTTLQDWPGRVGHWRYGIPPSGPMDSRSFRMANLLVGNEPGEVALECQFVGPELECKASVCVAVVGGDCAPMCDGEAMDMGRVFTVEAGQRLHCGALRTGARAYLAVAGGFSKSLVLDSAATFPRGGIGGRALAADEDLALKAPSTRNDGYSLRDFRAVATGDPLEIEVVSGPHLDWLAEDGLDALAGAIWTVSPRSDRTGIRLDGPDIGYSKRAYDKTPDNGTDPTNVINTGYSIGGINVCGGTPIILPVDGPSQGGFITPLVVASAALPKVGQLRPNQKIVFRRIALADAIDMARTLEAELAADAIEAGA